MEGSSTRLTYLEDLESSNVKDPNKVGARADRAIQRLVDTVDYPFEQTFIEGLRQSLAGELALCVCVLYACVGVHVFVCVCMYLCVCVCVCVCCTHVWVCMYLCVCVLYACVGVHVFVCVCVVRMCGCVCICVCVCVYK